MAPAKFRPDVPRGTSSISPPPARKAATSAAIRSESARAVSAERTVAKIPSSPDLTARRP